MQIRVNIHKKFYLQMLSEVQTENIAIEKYLLVQ